MRSGEAPVEIVEYDSTWPMQFEQERDALSRALALWLAGPIEHIGSTAIPGLAAKPVIDIMAGVKTLDGSRGAIEAAATLTYCYFPYQPDIKHWFCNSPHWVRPLAFRNYVRAHPDVAAEYEQLKRRLAGEFRFDREAYTNAKSPFIDAVTEKALAARAYKISRRS